ncbi:MAG: hypothetical protein DIU78_023130 [Pseudomonadota bacterium]|nr:MAG: hypothetical protein DIU78_03885 [Pseudomonadota bacterium]
MQASRQDRVLWTVGASISAVVALVGTVRDVDLDEVTSMQSSASRFRMLSASRSALAPRFTGTVQGPISAEVISTRHSNVHTLLWVTDAAPR